MTNHRSATWLNSGDEAFGAMLKAIDSAVRSIHFETYIFADDEVGSKFREALIRARERGVAVKVLIDGLGSFTLASNFWRHLEEKGGEARWFNPIGAKRFAFRNHRKLLVCDESIAFIGGFNVSKDYQGDGIKSGWRDLGLYLDSPLVSQLVASFEEMFDHAAFQPRRLRLWQKTRVKKLSRVIKEELLFSGPGRGRNIFKHYLRHDLARAKDVKIMAAYFLPTWRMRRDLARIVQRGGRVQLILAGKSDVFLSQLAGRSLYHRLLRAGVEIHEYVPQILHAKLIVIDNMVYAGSSNLDPRSLQINYELMLRFENKSLAAEAQKLFTDDLERCQRVELAAWRKSRTWWKKLRQRWAYFVIARLDPIVARWQFKNLLSQ